MKIIFTGQYKENLLKGFLDGHGKMRDVGQDILEEILAPYGGESITEMDGEGGRADWELQEADHQFIGKLRHFCDNDTLRYAKIDFLYWCEFQNRCSDHIQAFLAYFRHYKNNTAIKEDLDAQKLFVERLDHLNVIMRSLVDILNCEKCGGCSYFALIDDILEIFEKLLNIKIIGVQETLAIIVDVIESLFLLCANAKQPLKYGYRHEQVKIFTQGVLLPFLGQFLDHANQISKVTSKEIEERVVGAKIKNFKENKFVEIELPNMQKYSLVTSYALFARLLLVYTSDGLFYDEHQTQKFETDIPPQTVFETLIRILNNKYLHKDFKILTLQVMLKLSQLDIVNRFNYESGRKNPYFMESTKYLQTYIDIFTQLCQYHCHTKLLQEDPAPLDKKATKTERPKTISPTDSDKIQRPSGSGNPVIEAQIREVERLAIKKHLSSYLLAEEKEQLLLKGVQEDCEGMIKDGGAGLAGSVAMGEQGKEQQVEACKPEDDFIRSQAFLSQFLDYLTNIAKVRMRQVNQAIFPQIMPQIVQLISMKYDMKRQRYPLTLITQCSACKLLKDILRTQQSFDDTQKLNQIIEKLKQEIQLIRVQSQVNCQEFTSENESLLDLVRLEEEIELQKTEGDQKGQISVDTSKKRALSLPFHAKGSVYLRLFEQAWPLDDEYFCRYQTMNWRQMLIKQLLRLLCFCIKRNDPNLVSYNQNFIAHSRKILESSILQDDILINIFKVHETLQIQKDKKSRDQIEDTVSPLVLASTQLVTAVFNDLPSKIQTFMQNGLFNSVISSLIQGGFPASPEMLLVLTNFMQLLILNQDARDLLIQSNLISQFFKICLKPEQFHRCVQMGREDERITDQLISIANCHPTVCEQIIETFKDMSEYILKRSKQLTLDYVAMDQQLREIEKQIKELEGKVLMGQNLSNEIKQLEIKKNELRTPYELDQLNFENFFGAYVSLFSNMFDAERFENQGMVDLIQKCLVKMKKDLLQVAYLGIQNPVMASALHQLSEEYIAMILHMVSCTQPEDDPNRLLFQEKGNELGSVIQEVVGFLVVQVNNLKILLNKKNEMKQKGQIDQNMNGSSLVDDEANQIKESGQSQKITETGTLPGFNDYQDLQPGYCEYLQFFEEKTPIQDSEVTKNYAKFINGDNKIVAEDQATIVLRKIYFYCEMLCNYLRMQTSIREYERVALLFKFNPDFKNLLVDLHDLSALITKNRGINYSKTIKEDQRRLELLLRSSDNLRNKVESYSYDKIQKKQRIPVTSELLMARYLYFKYKKNLGDVSLVKHLDALQDSADVTNFECDDTICTNAQATQGKIKKLLKIIQQTIRTGRSRHDLALLEKHQFETCARLGAGQVDQCVNYIENGMRFVQWTQGFKETQGMIDQDMFAKFDNILFDMISGLSETLKMTGSDKMPAPTIDAFAKRIVEVELFKKLFNFATDITIFVERLLKEGFKIPLFRISYLKVLWKDIHSLILTFMDLPYIPRQRATSEHNNFILSFASKRMRDEYTENQQFLDKVQSNALREWEQEILHYETLRFKEQFKEVHWQIYQAMFDSSYEGKQIYMFSFFNKYCQRQFLNLAIKFFENMTEKIEFPSCQKLWEMKTSAFDFYYTGVLPSKTSELARRQGQLLQNFIRRGVGSPTYSQDEANMPPAQIDGAMRIGSLGNGQYIYARVGPANFQEAVYQDESPLAHSGDPASNRPTDEAKLQNLTDMGFDREKAQQALARTNNSLSGALEQLIQEQKVGGGGAEEKGPAGTVSEDSGEKQWPKDWNQAAQTTEGQNSQVGAQLRKQREQMDFNQAVNKVKENNSRNAEAKTEVDKLIKSVRPEIKSFSSEIMVLKLKVINQMVQAGDQNIIYGQFGFDKEVFEVYGYQVRLDMFYKQIQSLFVSFGSLTKSMDTNQKEIQTIFFAASKEIIELDKRQLSQEDLNSASKLKDMVVRFHIFQKLLQHRIYHNHLGVHDQTLSPCSLININLNILNATIQRLKIIFNQLKEIRTHKLNEKHNLLVHGTEIDETTAAVRTEREVLSISIPLLKVLIQMAQENLSSLLVDSLFDLKVNSSINLMQTVQDASGNITKPTEADILKKVICIQEFQKKIKDLFGGKQDDEKVVKETLSKIMHTQIGLLKIYNNTPREFVNKKDDIHYPISISFRLLRYIFQIHDYTVGHNALLIDNDLQNEGETSNPDGQNALNAAKNTCPLRKQFMQMDGLKYVFGVRVIDHICDNPQGFQNQKYQEFDQENWLYVGLVEELVQVLSHNRSSIIKSMMVQIKQLMFVQFKQKCKREGSKDFSDILKMLQGQGMQSKSHGQASALNAERGSKKDPVTSPVLNESKRQNQKGTQSQKKGAQGNPRNQSSSAHPNDHQSQNLHRIQQKHLKMILKKHDIDNEVPLSPFLDFFLQSNSNNHSLIPPIMELDLFLIACRNTCVINVVDMPESESSKLITIKLKTNVLRDLILEAKSAEESINSTHFSHTKQKGGNQGNNAQSNMMQNWSSELKKQMPSIQFQHDMIQQLLDIFIMQNKGYKMTILKQLKAGKIGGQPLPAVQKLDEPRINYKDGKVLLEVEPFKPSDKEDEQMEIEGKGADPKKQISVLEMQEYIFDMDSILLVIASEIIKCPSLIGSVMKHRDQKTFKYIIRNIIALRHLKIVGQDMQIVFQQFNEDQIDRSIIEFFRVMLLDRPPFSPAEKLFRNEARRIFIKEITKNIVEHDQQHLATQPQLQAPDENSFSTKLLQNYTSFLLLDSILMTQEKTESRLSDRLKGLNKYIKRYNHAQKLQLMIRILYETQLYSGSEKQSMQNAQGSGVPNQINFFKQMQRIIQEIQDSDRNPIIMHKSIALSKTVEVVLQIINHFASQSEQLTSIIQTSSRKKLPDVKQPLPAANTSAPKQDHQKPSSPPSLPHDTSTSQPVNSHPKGQQKDNLQKPSQSLNQDPSSTQAPGAQSNKENQKTDNQVPQDAATSAQAPQAGDPDDVNVDDVSLTVEDRLEIEQLKEETARTQLRNVMGQVRQVAIEIHQRGGGGGLLVQAADGEEDDEVGVGGEDGEGEDGGEEEEMEDDDFSDSYQVEEIEGEEEGEHDLSGRMAGVGSRGIVDRRPRSLSSHEEEMEIGLYGSDDFVSSNEYEEMQYGSEDEMNDDDEGLEDDEQMEDESVQTDLLNFYQGLDDLRNEYEDSILLEQGRHQNNGDQNNNSNNQQQDRSDIENENINIDDIAFGEWNDHNMDDEEEDVTEEIESEDRDSFDDDAGIEFDDEVEELGGAGPAAGGQIVDQGQIADFGDHDAYQLFMRREGAESSYEDMSESSFDRVAGQDVVMNNLPSIEEQLRIPFINAKRSLLPSIMHQNITGTDLIELFQTQQEYQLECNLHQYCQTTHRPMLRKDVQEGDWQSGMQARRHIIDAMKQMLQILCNQLLGLGGLALQKAKELLDQQETSNDDNKNELKRLLKRAQWVSQRAPELQHFEKYVIEYGQMLPDTVKFIMSFDKETIKQNVSYDDWMVFYICLLRIVKGMRDLVEFELRMDVHLYMSNMTIINHAYSVLGYNQGNAKQNTKTNLVDFLSENHEGSNQINQSHDSQSQIKDQSIQNNNDHSLDNLARMGGNELVKLKGTQSYEEFRKALRVLSGEEPPSPSLQQQQKSCDDNQIDSSSARVPPNQNNDAVDQIDPLFMEALNVPSIQAIKEGDQLIKKIQNQSSLPNVNKPYVQTINDFIKNQSQSVRQTLLKGLEQHVLTHLTPDLFKEANRLRQPQNAQQRAQGDNQAQNQRGRPLISARQNRYLQGNQQQVPQQALSSLAGERRIQNANNTDEFNQRVPPRDRLQSMESDLLQIGEQKNRINRLRQGFGQGQSQLRDSESEDVNMPAVRLNLTDQAFSLALHTFLKETLDSFDSLVIKDQIKQDLKVLNSANQWKKKETAENASIKNNQIITNVDLRDYCEHLVIEYFKDQEVELGQKQSQQIDSSSIDKQVVKTNIKQIVGLLDIALTEMKIFKQDVKSINDVEFLDKQKFKRLDTIMQVPNFRIGIVVKLIKIMNNEIAQLMSYVEKYEALTGDATNQALLTKRSLSAKLPVYKGSTKVWQYKQDTQAVLLSPKKCLTFFLKSIYEIQNILFEQKSSATTNGLLDLLKSPATDPHLRLLYQELGILNSFKMLDRSPEAVINMTLLDQILHMVYDCIILTTGNPEAFDFQEFQEKELNKWKHETLQNLCRILQQIDVSLNIVGRKLRGRVPQKQIFRLTLQTVNKLFQILLFANQADDRSKKVPYIFDNSPKSIAIVSKVLNRISLMPLQLPQSITSQYPKRSSDLIDDYGDNDEQVNLLKIYQQQQAEPRREDDDVVMDDGQEKGGFSDSKANTNIVTVKIVQTLNVCMRRFYEFFEKRFEIMRNLAARSGSDTVQSVLSSSSSREKSELTRLIEQILYVFKISLNLAQSKGNQNGTKSNSNEFDTISMLQEEQQLTKLLQIVQMVIDNEENFERQSQPDSKRDENHLIRTYLYKDEFKLILQLVFTLSQHDLKHSKITQATQPSGQEQQQRVQRSNQIQNGPAIQQDDQAQQQDAGAPLALVPLQEAPGNGREPPGRSRSNSARSVESIERILRQDRRNRREQIRRNGRRDQQAPPILFQTAEQIRREYDPTFVKKNQSSKAPSELEKILENFKEGRSQDLVKFFYNNKRLLNQFIQMNQSAATMDHFLNFVIQLPQILDFESKRLLWRLCIKKHLRKSNQEAGEYEIDIQIRRNQVFADSFEQLKDIQIESWKQKFTVEFHDEEGVDEGGLLKEWFELISQGIFDPNYALFQQSAQGSTYYPNPNADVHDEQGEMVAMFRFVGRIMGKALNEGQLLDCYLVKALYKMMLGQTLELSDLQDFDEQIYKSLIYMLENDAEILCQTFILSSKYFDENKDVQLIPNGHEIDVTNENKFEYCQKVLEHRLYLSIKPQIEAFLQGFRDLVPANLIQIFDYKELELMLSGLPTVDIDDLKENVIYKNYSAGSPVIQWLWEVLEELNNSERAEFIQFITASSKVPIEGFKGLRGGNGQIQKVEIIKLTTDSPDKRLPQAHTCFFQLDLPEYSSKEILRKKLLIAIKEGKNFNIA